jgi:hypothetical protein
MSLSEYCRELEAYLCRKNDGHLIRITGPSFEIVSRWAADGVPLKVAMAGIDRYFERYYRKGARRRPVKIDFCDADVLDMFDQWRRATGVATGEIVSPAGNHTEPASRSKTSLPEHLTRVLTRLTSLQAAGTIGAGVDVIADRLSAELDVARRKPGGVRGEDRRALLERLAALDRELIALVRNSAGDAVLRDAAAEAERDLAAFRDGMPAEAFSRALDRAIETALRARLGLPVVEFS